MPGGDYKSYVQSHVRWLEALRRAGIVERIDAEFSAHPKRFRDAPADYDAQRRGRMTIRLLSTLDLEVQIAAQRCIQDGLRRFGRTLAENSARCAYFTQGITLWCGYLEFVIFGAFADLVKGGEKTGANLRTEAMQKTDKARKPSKAKLHAQKGKGLMSATLDLFNNMDEGELCMLLHSMQTETGFGPDFFGPEDPVDLFAEYLQSCTEGEADEDDKNELLADLVEVFTELKINSNGGHREAREKIRAIYELLENAIEAHSLSPVDLMITGKILADAGWAVPDSLKQAMAEALQTAPPNSRVGAGTDIISSLLEVADQAGQNPFDVYEYMNSFIAGFPPEVSVMLLYELIAGKKAVIDQAVAGFLLHPDALIAQSAADALAASAKQTPVESSLIERLVRMRPWLPETRQAHLDVTIRAMRLNALPPVKTELPKVIKCYVSVCDGSGTRSLFVTQKVGAYYQISSVMMKLAGVADAMVLSELSKSGMDDIVRQMKTSIPVMEADLARINRMFGLAVADNFASGHLPPFKFVEVVESLGLGPVHPDHATPMEIIMGLLADLPPDQTNPTAVARAHADILDSEFTYQWFEAGEALEDLLYPIKGSKTRVTKLMKTYLPDRRPFWARQCAISALATHGDERIRHSPWKQLALVGRDIASDLPLDQIPVMKQVAETSVRAFEGRL